LVLLLQNQKNHPTLPLMQSLTEEQRDLIERIGVLHDRMGIRPAAGRILGLLLVSPDPELTFDQIRLALDLSKSATSTALRYLQDVGSVEYRTRPGDRKRYFRKSFTDWEAGFVQRSRAYYGIRTLLAEALDQKGEGQEEFKASLERMIGFLTFLDETIETAYQQWQSTHQPPDGDATAGNAP
jgi:DNA-binding transcriptional regulator GbsR (MarR family)